MTARFDWDDLPGDAAILNITGKGLCPALVAKLGNRMPAARPPQVSATVPGVPPIPSQPGWSVDKLLCDHAIATYHGEVQALVNRGLQPHEAHEYLRDHQPELQASIRRYSEAASEAAMTNSGHHATGREALNAYREAVEALCNRGVNYSEAHRQVQAARPEWVEAMRNADPGADAKRAIAEFMKLVRSIKEKRGAAITWGEAWRTAVTEHPREYEACGKPKAESMLSGHGLQLGAR